ncbi:hypothetical protein TNCV_4786021 [Trichonephila clavipes]|nr:hypothetical protein TNCV_4786021 [Trichonephila clavipes]
MVYSKHKVRNNNNNKKTTPKTFYHCRKKRKKNEAEQNDPWNRPGCPTLRALLAQCTSRSAIIQKRATKKCPFRAGIKKKRKEDDKNGMGKCLSLKVEREALGWPIVSRRSRKRGTVQVRGRSLTRDEVRS